MENSQFKGFAYTKGGNKPTVVYGTSSEDILAKLNSYNIARTEQDKFVACNIGSLNAETSKYGDYHRYEVATGKDISPIYLQIPPLEESKFRKVVADLNAADAKFNSYKKRWYITPDQDLQKFQAICNQFSKENIKDATQQTPKKTIDIHTELEKIDQMIEPLHNSNVPFQIERMEIQYAVKMENQQTVIFPESTINMLRENSSMNEFLDRLNEKAVEQLQQLSNDQEQIDPEQIVAESEYSISTSKDSADNRCTIWFNDGREPINFLGDEYGLHFPTMEADAVADFVSEYFRQQDHPELSMQMEYRKGDWIDCYVPLRLQDSSPNQPIYVENVRHIVGRVQNVQTIQAQEGVSGAGTEGKSYEIFHGDGSTETIRSDEIYAPDQARVLLRAAADELTGVQFDLLADRRLSAAQMEEIRFGFKDGLSVEQVALYANPAMTSAEMDLCRIGLTNGLEYAELSRLLKETKELSWTDSRNRLNEVIKEHGEKTIEEPIREERAETRPAEEKEKLSDPADAVAPEQPVTAPELSEIQVHIAEYIDKALGYRVNYEPIENDKIRVNWGGNFFDLAMTSYGAIINENQNKILKYVKDGYRPTAAPKLSEIQAHIVEHINEALGDSVNYEPIENDKIQVINWDGTFFDLAMTPDGEIIDDKNMIMGYAKDGYRPHAEPEKDAFSENMIPEEKYEPYAAASAEQKAAQTADFYGLEVPVENGMRVITMEEIYHVNEQGIEKPDFSNCVFRGIDFPSFFPTLDVNFANSRFYQCRFIDFDMSQSNFRGASLQETYLKDVVLEQCDFGKASLENVRIRSSELTRVNFSEATMRQIYFENCGMEENDFNMTQMDCVHVYDSCDITADQKNLDTVTYTISGADPAEIEKTKDKMMWRLSGSEVKYERKEELSRLFEKESNDPDTQEWREDLTYEERELVESWDKQRHTLSDVLLEKQHRQERYNERYNSKETQSGEKRSVVNQLHEKQKMVSAAVEAPAREDRIKKADAIAK